MKQLGFDSVSSVSPSWWLEVFCYQERRRTPLTLPSFMAELRFEQQIVFQTKCDLYLNSKHVTTNNFDPFSWTIPFSFPLQIISSAVVLAVSLVLGAVSLMGLSQGDREQTGYQALSRAAVTGNTEEPTVPAGPEDPQQQQMQVANSPTCSIDSGSFTVCFGACCVFVSVSK